MISPVGDHGVAASVADAAFSPVVLSAVGVTKRYGAVDRARRRLARRGGPRVRGAGWGERLRQDHAVADVHPSGRGRCGPRGRGRRGRAATRWRGAATPGGRRHRRKVACCRTGASRATCRSCRGCLGAGTPARPRRTPWISSACPSRSSAGVGHTSSRAGSGSGWRWRAPWRPRRALCCSTSRSGPWTPSRGATCRPCSSACGAPPQRRCCS